MSKKHIFRHRRHMDDYHSRISEAQNIQNTISQQDKLYSKYFSQKHRESLLKNRKIIPIFVLQKKLSKRHLGNL